MRKMIEVTLKLTLTLILVSLGVLSTLAKSEEDLSFISDPIVDSLIGKLDEELQNPVKKWVKDDQNAGAVSRRVIELMRSGTISNNEIALGQMTGKSASAALIEVGVPDHLLGLQSAVESEPPVDRLLAMVPKSDAVKIAQYFKAFPDYQKVFEMYAQQQVPILQALKQIGYPFSQEMEHLLTISKLSASRDKYSKLYAPSKYKGFCKELIASPATSALGHAWIYNAGIVSSFIVGNESDFYGQVWGLMTNAEKAEYEVMNPQLFADMRFQGGAIEGLVTSIREVNIGMWSLTQFRQQPSLIEATGFDLKKREGELRDTCEDIVEVYLEEIGL
ncbi:hypothetical protein N9L12_03220 [Luminiphilus sp.]|nr:hypothetical protein [Luminiphilus sp.]